AFDADTMLLDGVGSVHRHLVVGGVAVLHAEVVILDRQVEIGMDELVLDRLPDDPRHLVAVEIDDRIGDFDFAHRKLLPEIRIVALWPFGVPYSIGARQRKAGKGQGVMPVDTVHMHAYLNSMEDDFDLCLVLNTRMAARAVTRRADSKLRSF